MATGTARGIENDVTAKGRTGSTSARISDLAPANDGRMSRVTIVLDAAADAAAGDSVVAAVASALELAAPELLFIVERASRAVAAPLAATAAGTRDFRVAAALGRRTAGPRDVTVLQAVAPPAGMVLRIRPLAAASAFCGPLGPPLEGLCSLTAPLAAADAPLIALALVAHVLSASSEPDLAKDADAARLVARLSDMMLSEPLPLADAGALRRQEVDVLAAWSAAWTGLAAADEPALEDARRALDILLADASRDFTPRETAQLNANLAIVCLALGGAAEGSRRLGEGLCAARAARDMVAAEREPAAVIELDGLIGELASALGQRHRDARLLGEAVTSLDRALSGLRRVPAGERWAHVRQRASAALSGL